LVFSVINIIHGHQKKFVNFFITFSASTTSNILYNFPQSMLFYNNKQINKYSATEVITSTSSRQIHTNRNFNITWSHSYLIIPKRGIEHLRSSNVISENFILFN
jgi:hypothetical protein